MKNKFVTAVTTAGLLAGILGSAYAPSVKAAAGVLDATETTFAETNTLTGDGLLSTTPLQLVSATMAAVNEADATITFDIEDSSGTDLPAGSIYTATTTGPIRIANGTALVTSVEGYYGGTSLVLEMAASSTTATGTGTLTIRIGGGSKTVYYRAVGATSALTLTNKGATALAGGKASEVNKIELAVVDASGFALAVPADADVTWELGTGSAGAIGDVVEADDDGKFSLDTTACDAATSLTAVGDTAKSYIVRAKVGDVFSNYVTVKCTDDGEFAKITGATASARTADLSGTITVTFTVQDGFGNALGYGAVVDINGAGGHELAGTYYPTANAAAGDTKGSLATAGRTGDVTISTVGSWTNVITVDSWARNAYVTYTLVDSDLSTAEAQAWTKTFKFASVEPAEEFEASISKSRFTVTADFGVAFKGKKISIVVENVATGSVVTYSRKANSLGKVSYTIGRRGTFEIYAMSGDTLTDTVVVKR
jgi:hypothetical protein